MSGNRPPDPPAYPFDSGAVLEAAAARNMRVRFKSGADGYGWVYCPVCGWGCSESAIERMHWMLDLSFYQRWPWGCGVCEPAKRAEARRESGLSPTT